MLIFGGAYLMTSLQKTLGAVLYLLGSIGLCVFYGLRWFNDGTPKTLGYSGKWPPMVNMCPDYFSLYTDRSGDKYCVDYVGFSSRIKKFTKGNEINAITFASNQPSFNSNTNAIPTKNVTTAQNCAICQAASLTWEGVYDGNSCSTYIGSPGSLASQGCPTTGT